MIQFLFSIILVIEHKSYSVKYKYIHILKTTCRNFREYELYEKLRNYIKCADSAGLSY